MNSLIKSVRRHIRLLILIFVTSSFVYCKDETYSYEPGLIVILKADDLGEMTPNWGRFMHIVFKDSICASVGIIADRVKTDSSIVEIQKISDFKRINNFPIIEFWNHGFNHFKEKNKTEFNGSTYEYQVSHLQMSQDFFKNKLQIQCHSFGAPYNRTDKNTFKALNACPEICTWFCLNHLEKEEKQGWKNPNNDKIGSDDNRIVLDVDYYYYKVFPIDKMINNYSKDKKKPYIVIQIHPLMWKNENFIDFEKLIDFYKQRKATFMTPYQYYQFLHKNYEGDSRI